MNLVVALYVFKNVIVLLLMALQLAMLVRAILSWFPIENGFVDFIYSITEPFIYPVRVLFERMNWFQNLPIDISFMVSYLLLSLLLILLT